MIKKLAVKIKKYLGIIVHILMNIFGGGLTLFLSTKSTNSTSVLLRLFNGLKLLLSTKKQYNNCLNKNLSDFNKNFHINNSYLHLCLSDFNDNAGVTSAYFWQDLWAAKHIFEDNPKVHFDIGSRLDGFIAHLLSFRKNITLIDIRPLPVKIPNLEFIEADATNLDGIEDESIESLSALCSLEHFGLGRYGDPVDPDACFKAFNAIQKKMIVGGKVYISVPIGYEHLEFNAHRVFYPETLINCFDEMKLIEFSCIPNDDKIEYNVDIHKYDNYVERGGILVYSYLKKWIVDLN
ncbi:MAG: DUF268 domain-containing protein [Methanobrevibacter sp.]|jgi:hypothetical protein|nr:DUF268 domain-containing protein [Candidatus Methanoflexus mossambicus]